MLPTGKASGQTPSRELFLLPKGDLKSPGLPLRPNIGPERRVPYLERQKAYSIVKQAVCILLNVKERSRAFYRRLLVNSVLKTILGAKTESSLSVIITV